MAQFVHELEDIFRAIHAGVSLSTQNLILCSCGSECWVNIKRVAQVKTMRLQFRASCSIYAPRLAMKMVTSLKRHSVAKPVRVLSVLT